MLRILFMFMLFSEKISARMETLEKAFPSKTFHPTLISAAPARRNEYSDIFLSQLTVNDLFLRKEATPGL